MFEFPNASNFGPRTVVASLVPPMTQGYSIAGNDLVF